MRSRGDNLVSVESKQAEISTSKPALSAPIFFKCPECPVTLNRLNMIQKHILVHRPRAEWQYECCFCSGKSRTREAMRRHYKQVHKNNAR